MYSCVSLNFAWWLLSCDIVLLYVFAVFLQFDNSVFLFLFSLLAYYISFNKDYYYYYGAYRVSVILYRNLLWSPMFFLDLSFFLLLFTRNSAYCFTRPSPFSSVYVHDFVISNGSLMQPTSCAAMFNVVVTQQVQAYTSTMNNARTGSVSRHVMLYSLRFMTKFKSIWSQ